MLNRKWILFIVCLATAALALCAFGCTKGDDDDDNNDAGDDDDDDDSPQVTGINHGTCKNGAGQKDGGDYPEGLLLSLIDGVLTVTHVNGVFNCCLDSIEVSVSVSGQTISLYEVENAPQPYDCECPYDVETQVTGLKAGSYTIDVYANGKLSINGQVTIQ